MASFFDQYCPLEAKKEYLSCGCDPKHKVLRAVKDATLNAIDSFTLNELIASVSHMDSKNDIPQTTYVIEECAEVMDEASKLIKCVTKNQRKSVDTKDLDSEACDVVCTIMIMLHQHGWSEEKIKEHMKYKYRRALKKYIEKGEI